MKQELVTTNSPPSSHSRSVPPPIRVAMSRRVLCVCVCVGVLRVLHDMLLFVFCHILKNRGFPCCEFGFSLRTVTALSQPYLSSCTIPLYQSWQKVFNDWGGRGYDDFVPGEVTKTAHSGDRIT